MTVQGHVTAGWEPVAEAFEQNFAAQREAGASVAVYRDGSRVVDLWGGVADSRTGRPWTRDTVACVFSTSKGLAAICVHILVQQGLLDLEAPVASYWPEFAAAGKQGLKVRWLLTHQAGLPVLDRDLSLDDLRAWRPLVDALEQQKPLWAPGTAHAYHAVTFGPLLTELVRRVAGRDLGALFADQVAGPLGLQTVLRLPVDRPLDLAHLEPPPVATTSLAEHAEEWVRHLVEISRRSITLGHALPSGLVTGQPGDFNDRRVLAVELAGSTFVSDARSLARAYAATVSDVDGVRLLTDDTAATCIPSQTAQSAPYGFPTDKVDANQAGGFGLGFIITPLLSSASFGHPGAGGSVGFADLNERIGFGYVPNRMGGEGDDRAASLIRAVRSVVQRQSATG
jgi:CubicO group peptidase (beta-lactamase class C family)